MSSLNKERRQWARNAEALRASSVCKPIEEGTVEGTLVREHPKQPIETLFLSNGVKVYYPQKREPYALLPDGKKVSLTRVVKNNLLERE